MRPKSLALVLVALGCGLVASIGIMKVMTKHGPEEVQAGAGQRIFVAGADIGMGDLLIAEMLKQEEWPKDKMPPGAITDIKEIDGRRTRARLYAGEPILENKLFAKGTSQQGAAAMITKGYRIVPVKVDLVSGGSSMILPGDRVDVMVHLVRDPSRGIKETVTRTILQDIRVFAVNDVLDIEKDKDGGKSINAKTISLLVTPKQATMVMLASQMGIVNLVMRSPETEEQADNAEARPSDLLGEVAKSDRDKEEPKDTPPPVKPPVVTPPPVVETPKPRATWTIQVLNPSGVDAVILEKDPKSDSALSVWKTVTPGTTASPDSKGVKEPTSVVEPPKAIEPPSDGGDDGGLAPEAGS
jgi:pilus assembly protein CpaB